jgi:hypothetical protein
MVSLRREFLRIPFLTDGFRMRILSKIKDFNRRPKNFDWLAMVDDVHRNDWTKLSEFAGNIQWQAEGEKLSGSLGL